MKKFISALCSVFLVLYFADGFISMIGDGMVAAFNSYAVDVIGLFVSFFEFVTGLLLYCMAGLTPMVPKRWFLPLILYHPAWYLVITLFSIYHYDWLPPVSCLLNVGQLVLGLWMLQRIQGKLTPRWPIVREEQLSNKAFSWLNLSGFLAANVIVLFPVVLISLVGCVSLAVSHFSGGFMELHTNGLSMEAKTYVRDDGKTIELMPMMHIGEAGFYKQVAKSFPPKAVILLEGVTDTQGLIKHKLDYSPAAEALGLSSQRETFTPPSGQSQCADVDVSQFTPDTIESLNLIAQLYKDGLKKDVLSQLSQKSSGNPEFTLNLMKDILVKRNNHLWQEIQTQLPRSNFIVVPWGAAHMPWISAQIEKAGFHVSTTQQYTVANFRTIWNALRARAKHDTAQIPVPPATQTSTP